MTIISRNLRNIQRRCFQTRADYEAWSQQMKATKMKNILHDIHDKSSSTSINDSVSSTQLNPVNPRIAAPFLYSVSPISDRLLLFENGSSHTDKSHNLTPYSSMLECIYPLSGKNRYGGEVSKNDLDILRSSVSDFGSWSGFRLAKFYSDVDALTADVAYRHVASSPKADTISFVTAGHYNSRKIHRTDVTKDIIFRCYPTSTGDSSMEIRTDAIQVGENKDGNAVEKLINVCFTSMVAVDKNALRPIKGAIPKLHEGDEEEGIQQMRTEMAEQHKQIRKQRFATSMQLRGSSSSPPTQEEMASIHNLQQRVVREEENLPNMSQFTYRSSMVVYPERRNVHGKLFGGFVMEQGHILAQYTADFFLHHEQTEKAASGAGMSRAIPLGLDEAIFLQPVSIGDHVTFTARVAHSTRCTCRVTVTVEVRDPRDMHKVPLRSNRLSFLFGGKNFPSQIVPNSYTEILMHVDAQRRATVEGPLDEEVDRILHEDGSK